MKPRDSDVLLKYAATAAVMAATLWLGGDVQDQPERLLASAFVVVAGIVLASLLVTPRRRPLRRRGEEAADGWRELGRELERSRRHEKSFALIRFPEPPPTAVPARGRGAHISWPTRLRSVLRHTDTAWRADDRLYLLLPEIDKAQAGHVLTRLTVVLPELANAPSAIVAFPEDAVTSGGLRSTLELRAREAATPVPLGAPVDRPDTAG